MEHAAGLVQGIRGTPAPMVTFLPGVPAALIESIPGKVHDVEGIHDRPSEAALFKPVNPSIATISMRSHHVLGWEESQVVKAYFGTARDHSQKPRGTATFSYGSYIQDDSDVPVPVRGGAPHVFIHANDTHPFTPSWIIDQQTRPFGQDSSVGSIPVFRPMGPRRRIDATTARTRTSTPSRVRAWRMRGAP